MTRQQLISIFFVVFLLFILCNVFLILSPFLQPIFWAAVISFGFFPVYEKLRLLFKNNPGTSAAVATLAIFFIFVPIVVFVIVSLSHEAVHFSQWLGSFIREGGAEHLLKNLRSLPLVHWVKENAFVPWEVLKENCEDWLLNSGGTIANFLVKQAAVITKNTLLALLDFFLTFFIVFFFFRDGEKIYRFIYGITPLEEDHKREIFKELTETCSAALRGQLLTALAQGITLGIVFWIIGLPLPIFFAALTMLAALIPVFGASLVWMPFLIYLGVTQQFSKFIPLLFLGPLVISGIDNILKPLLIGRKTKLPYSLLFLGIMGGIQVYGFMGMFLAPAILSLFFVLIKIYREKFFRETA